jgi:hypothetical protein
MIAAAEGPAVPHKSVILSAAKHSFIVIAAVEGPVVP